MNLISKHWVEIKDGNTDALNLFNRHYSKYHYRDGRQPKRFVGPGQRIVLLSPCKKALFVWRKFIDKSGQQGVNCAVFRNETGLLLSLLIMEAEKFAAVRWPGERYYTYVNADKVKPKEHPGYCFIKAGWKVIGTTKKRGLLILEKA